MGLIGNLYRSTSGKRCFWGVFLLFLGKTNLINDLIYQLVTYIQPLSARFLLKISNKQLLIICYGLVEISDVREYRNAGSGKNRKAA